MLRRAACVVATGAAAARAPASLPRHRLLSTGASGGGGSAAGRAPITWFSLAAATAAFGGAAFYFVNEKETKRKEAFAKQNKTVGKPKLGGPFTLVDHEGRAVTDASLRDGGHTHALLYFGFTFCPDICPAELIKMGAIIDKLDAMKEVGPVVRPVFITCDPKRDGVAQIAHYIKDFHARFLGLTGTPEQVAVACKAYRVYHSVADLNEDDEDDYLVDHSIVMYLVGPDGMFLDFYTQSTEVDEAVQRIAAYVNDPDE